MRADPLGFFADGKVAGEEPVKVDDQPKKLDPSERALAGLATQGSAYAIALPWVGREVLKHFAEKDSVDWGGFPAIAGATSMGKMELPAAPPSKRLLGLVDVVGRQRSVSPQATEEVLGKVDDIHGAVDSFFQKHDLANKGVTMNFRGGPLSSGLGPHYDPAEKKVFLPRVSKELALHELGHAADYTSSRFGKARAVAEPILRNAALTVIPIALIAGDEIAKAIPGTIDDKVIRFMQDHAPSIVGATLAATTLIPEAKASFLAIRHLHQTEGAASAIAAAKKLLPAWGTYALSVIPPIVGMALARRYLQHAREHNANNEKTAGFLGDAIGGAVSEMKEIGSDLAHVGKQIGHGFGQLVKDPNMASRLGSAAKEVGTSPHFIMGALTAAIPATAGALYLYSTESGKIIRDQWAKTHPDGKGLITHRPKDEDWRERHPGVFAGIVGLGAALSAGVMSKLINDAKEVL